MIDLSGYEGVHVLRATATVDGEDANCVIVANVDTDSRPHLVVWDCGEMTWASNSGECNYDNIKLHSIIGEMVLPDSAEAPAEPCNCDIPATCTISTECSETNPVVKELIGAMTQQFSMLVGVLEKLVQAE